MPFVEFAAAGLRLPGGRVLLDALSLAVEEGETLAVIGRSGSGKTTALKLVNALLLPTSGEVRVDGRATTTWDAIRLRRRTGYVIQEVGLFPHLTVARNVGLVPELEGWPRERIATRVEELLALVGLPAEEFATRYPHQLSGGQRQRVGVARALAADPPLLLLDEPFGALDPITRARLQHELLRVQHELRKTIIFVTHDIDEAILLGDRIAILREGGVLAQYDVPEAILARPVDDFVARFVGADRGIKLLGLRRLDELQLQSLDGAVGPRLPGATTLRDALSAMITAHARAVVVVDEDERPRGVVTLDSLAEQAE